METSPDHLLASYCSYGNAYATFLTSRERVHEDVARLLRHFGAPDAVRDTAMAKLADCPDFASGIRLEEGKDADRVVLYVTFPISFIDGKKKQLHDLMPELLTQTTSRESEAGAWPAQDAA